MLKRSLHLYYKLIASITSKDGDISFQSKYSYKHCCITNTTRISYTRLFLHIQGHHLMITMVLIVYFSALSIVTIYVVYSVETNLFSQVS